MLYVWPTIDLPLEEVWDIARRLTPLTEGLGIEQVVVSGRLPSPDGGEPVETVMRMGYEPGRGSERAADARRPTRRCSRSTTTPAS